MTRDEIEQALAITREAELPEFAAQHPAFADPAVVDLVINELRSELLRGALHGVTMENRLLAERMVERPAPDDLVTYAVDMMGWSIKAC